MTKQQVEVITSVQRRRRWSRAEKERIVAAALEPGAVASEVARHCHATRFVNALPDSLPHLDLDGAHVFFGTGTGMPAIFSLTAPR
jgi:hypothetical protein